MESALGTRPSRNGLDGRNMVAILTESNYQVASRIWLDAGRA